MDTIRSVRMVPFVLLIVCLCGLKSCVARVGFIKDQSVTRIEFPPKHVHRPGSTIPRGHMRPLGFQRDPADAVPELDTLLTPEEFYDEYVSLSRPVVFRNAMTDVPAVTYWQDSYLRKKYGSVIVQAVVAKGPQKVVPRKLTMKEYLRDYSFLDRWYLSNIIPKEMMKELVLPKMLKCGMTPYLQESHLWLTSGGSVSPVHSHADHNLHCLLFGRKDFVMYEPEYSQDLGVEQEGPHIGDGHSEMDAEMVNTYKYPRLHDLDWYWTTLKPGDCIYIPATYNHHVRSYGRSLSSTFLWAPVPDVEFSDCPSEEELDKPLLLTEAPFIWTYYKADRELLDRDLNPPDLRRHLKVWMRDEPTLRYSVFLDYYEEIMSEMPAETKPAPQMIWKLLCDLDDNQDTVEISRQHIEELGDPVLVKVAEYLNMPHALHGHDREDTPEEAEEEEDEVFDILEKFKDVDTKKTQGENDTKAEGPEKDVKTEGPEKDVKTEKEHTKDEL